MTGIDDHSRFVAVARLVVRASSWAVCAAFVEALGRFGVPEKVLTDNGEQFTGRFAKRRATQPEGATSGAAATGAQNQQQVTVGVNGWRQNGQKGPVIPMDYRP